MGSSGEGLFELPGQRAALIKKKTGEERTIARERTLLRYIDLRVHFLPPLEKKKKNILYTIYRSRSVCKILK